jgi:diamine N-acetyltransferase
VKAYPHRDGAAPAVRPGVSIRRATPDDAHALTGLARATFIETYGGLTRPEDIEQHLQTFFTPEDQLRELSDDRVVTLLAFAPDELAGFAQVEVRTPPACVSVPAALALTRFYVRRDWHGQGVAQALLASVTGAARAAGAAALWLSVWEHNPRAIAFYRKAGFGSVGTMDFTVGSDVQNDLVFLLPLAP